ncbi:MAG: hypothetical protein HZB38_02500, partial [Planctomycetes bacterium]|nr:hypothetical protein [Planctomycetota bacterium]
MRQFAVGAAAAALFSLTSLALAGGEQSNLQAGGAQLAAPSVEELPAATRNLLASYPGVQMTWSGPNIRGFMGVPMTEGATPQAAVDGFWATHQDAFGVANLELALRWANDVSFGRFTVYAYQQLMNGLPVEYSVGRVLVQSGQTYHVVYAAGIFAQPPIDGFAPDVVSADAALASVQTMPEYQGMPIWSVPELVVYAGQEFEMGVGDGRFGAPVRAWKFVGDNGILEARAKRTFFVNAATGQLIASRSEIHHTDVSGTVRGMGSPGTNPDIASNPPAAMAMPEIRVSITGGSTVYGDSNGAFTIPNAGTTAVTVTSSVATGATTGGRWAYVNNVPGAEITASATVTPPGPAALMFNATPSALNTAQVNAFVHTNLIHNFVTDRSSWTGMNIVMPNNVNIASTCNAYYDGSSINFYQAGGGCAN